LRNGALSKIEVNFVMRGTVHPVRMASLAQNARETLQADLEIPVVSLEDMYGGKLVAAMDRQHPRDLLDVPQLFAHEGITAGIRRAFVVYLASQFWRVAKEHSRRGRAGCGSEWSASIAIAVSGLPYVDLAAMRHLTTGLTFDFDQCTPVLDHALRGLNEQTRIPDQLIAWIRAGAFAAGPCPYDRRGRIIIDVQQTVNTEGQHGYFATVPRWCSSACIRPPWISL
jgi:hypothetical protein